jgi:hypothetical protein
VVLRFATLTRDFAQAVETTHNDATKAIAEIAAAHQGASTEAMSSGWVSMSGRHVYEVVDACHVLADAVEGAAGYIVAQKAEAVAVLVGLAAAFVADQAAAVATAGLAEAAVPVLIAAAERLVKSLVMDLEQHLVAAVVEAAAKPLFAKVEAAMAGLDWSRSGAGVEPGEGFSIDPSAVREQLAVLRGHAVTMREHGERYRAAVGGLGF